MVTTFNGRNIKKDLFFNRINELCWYQQAKSVALKFIRKVICKFIYSPKFVSLYTLIGINSGWCLKTINATQMKFERVLEFLESCNGGMVLTSKIRYIVTFSCEVQFGLCRYFLLLSVIFCYLSSV